MTKEQSEHDNVNPSKLFLIHVEIRESGGGGVFGSPVRSPFRGLCKSANSPSIPFPLHPSNPFQSNQSQSSSLSPPQQPRSRPPPTGISRSLCAPDTGLFQDRNGVLTRQVCQSHAVSILGIKLSTHRIPGYRISVGQNDYPNISLSDTSGRG